MSKSKKLVFFGNERLATAVDTKAPTLRMLVEEGCEIAVVVANYTAGVSRNSRSLEIVEVAHAYHIPVVFPENTTDIAGELKRHEAEAAILVAYGKIIPKSILDIFRAGIINIHPSLLPAYRGSTPIETAILDGVKETGVSLMKLAEKMDTGAVFAKEEVTVSGNEPKQELADKLASIGTKLLKENLPRILNGSLSPVPQDESKASSTNLLSKQDGAISWDEPAELIERKVRAYLGFPKAHAKVHGHDIVISKARVAKNADDGALVLQCSPGYLEILELTAPSGRTTTGADFIRGYSN